MISKQTNKSEWRESYWIAKSEGPESDKQDLWGYDLGNKEIIVTAMLVL